MRIPNLFHFTNGWVLCIHSNPKGSIAMKLDFPYETCLKSRPILIVLFYGSMKFSSDSTIFKGQALKCIEY